MTGRRAKLLLILGGALLAGIVLTAWTQTWFTLTLDGGQSVVVDGSVAAPALTALALSELVLVGAIAIAGTVFRFVLGALQVLLGGTIALSAGLAVFAPVAASGAAVSDATGVAGHESIAALVDDVTPSAWPIVALVAGILLIVLAVGIFATARTWPGSTRKYQAVRTEVVGDERSSVDDWDSLSSGDDPTGDTIRDTTGDPTGDPAKPSPPA